MNKTYDWYKKLKKPQFAPPNWLFGVVWSILYPITFLTFGYVFYLAWKGDVSWGVTLPFILNLVFNFIFAPIQFRLQNNLLAAVDVVLIDVTLLWGIVMALIYFPLIAYLQIPYLTWVLTATCLQFSVTYLNWSRR